MSQKITNITIPVPYRGSGGVVRHHDVSFDVYSVDDHYTLRPCLSKLERTTANLPEELNFELRDGKPVSLRGPMDGNFHVIQDAVALLKEQKQLA